MVDVKRNPMDFVLWKMSKEGEPSWPSPWGAGRPGWHIECSAMNCKQLGNHFDIHGGGSDLMFPHHENEIAQSTCAHDGEYVNYWMHSGMVMVDREKMSKSLGNFFTVRDVLKYYDAETIRYFLMSGHYRSQLNYSEENLKQARSALERLYTALRGTDKSVDAAGGEAFEARFIEAMDDDFNTPEAYSVLFDMAREVNRLKTEDAAAANAMAAHLRKLAAVLGLLEQEPEACFVAVDKTDTPVGYILCSKDYQAYQARFRKSYLPLIQARSILRAALARMDLRIAGRYAGQYPAHMHIDILDAYQRMGIGHQLVNTLTASLAGQTTRGLMLSVGSTNKRVSISIKNTAFKG